MSLSGELSTKLYQSISEDNEERIFDMWHASSLAICPRAHYFKRANLPPTAPAPTAAKMLRWKAGHLMEEAIRPHVAKVWAGDTKVESNQRLTNKRLQLTGEFDNHAVEGKTLIEIKTVHDYAFIERENTITLKKEKRGEDGNLILSKWGKPAYEPMLVPYLHHEIQNHGYVLLMAEEKVTIDAIDYVYITLSGRIVVYHTEVNKKLLERVVERLKLLNEAWKKQTPPDCLCNPNSPLWGGVYQWCDYRVEGGVCCDISKT